MALRIDYLAKETGNNLVRNPSLTIATILTVSVSLVLLGTALLIRRGVDDTNIRFQDGVEFIVWLAPDVSPEQRDSVDRALEESPAIENHRFINREETFQEFQAFWENSPEILDAVEPEQLPTSFRVVPVEPDLAVVEALGREYESLPGVTGVDFAGEYIRRLNSFTDTASRIMLFASFGSVVASALLMYNSIRTALFARRREVEVMRLVGATNSFIRIPFVLEGLTLGVFGAGLSVLGVFGLNRVIRNGVQNADIDFFDGFALEPSDLTPIVIYLLIAGAAIGAIGSFVAVNRYLDA